MKMKIQLLFTLIALFSLPLSPQHTFCRRCALTSGKESIFTLKHLSCFHLYHDGIAASSEEALLY